MKVFLTFLYKSYTRTRRLLNSFQSPLLLLIRLYWGSQFALAGWGKFQHLDHVAAFFSTLNLPAPYATAVFVALVEFAGGILFAVGLGARLVSLILFLNMTVAFWTADREAFGSILSNPDKFLAAAPYTYWFAALLILIFGPGMYAMDRLLLRYWSRAEQEK